MPPKSGCVPHPAGGMGWPQALWGFLLFLFGLPERCRADGAGKNVEANAIFAQVKSMHSFQTFSPICSGNVIKVCSNG